MNSSNVEISWDNFIKAIHEQVRLPQPFTRTVIEAAVTEALELLIQPRKNMAEIIFGTANELTLEELRQSASYITVYPYLPNALIKYMHRKQLSSLSKEKATQIIAQVDDKLTEKYTPLNWAQLFDSLFILLGDEIESEVFRQFFADKNRQRWADYFDKETEDINRTRFIEILSLPELDGIEKYIPGEEFSESSSYFEYDAEVKLQIEVEKGGPTNGHVSIKEKIDEVSVSQVRSWGLDETETTIEVTSEKTQEKTWEIDNYESDVLDSDTNQENNELESTVDSEIKNNNSDAWVDETSLLTDSSDDIKEEKPDSNSWGERKTSIVFETEPETDSDLDVDDQPIYKKIGQPNQEPTLADKIKTQEDVPFWKRFVSHDEPESHKVEAKDDTSDLDILVEALQDMEDEFIQDLFGGDQNAYVLAIDDISAFDFWEDASKYVKDEIIRVGMLDPLSDTCIEFVDRLQNHFSSKHS